MKVLINARMLQKGILEGIGTYTKETAIRMAEQHPEDEFVFVFDRAFDPEFVALPNCSGVKVGPPTRHPILWKYWFERRIPRLINTIKPDVFYSPDGYCSLKSKIPTVMVSHDLAFEHFDDHNKAGHLDFYRTYSPQYHKRADAIIAVSRATKNDIISKYNIGQHKIHLGYNAVNTAFKPIDDSLKTAIKNKYVSGSDFILYLGAIHPRKNTLALIKAFETYKDSSKATTSLVLAGRKAWKTESFDKALRSSPYKESIIHLAGVKDDIYALMAAASVFVYPSLFEGFGIPILEAMSAGVPVICSNRSSMPEVAGEAAISVDPTDPQEMATAIQWVMDDQNQRESMIEKGIKRAKTFDWDDTAKTIYSVLRTVSL